MYSHQTKRDTSINRFIVTNQYINFGYNERYVQFQTIEACIQQYTLSYQFIGSKGLKTVW